MNNETIDRFIEISRSKNNVIFILTNSLTCKFTEFAKFCARKAIQQGSHPPSRSHPPSFNIPAVLKGLDDVPPCYNLDIPLMVD